MAVNHIFDRTMPIVHSVAKAILEGFALFANSRARPVAVAERFKTLVPNLIEIVGVDVALRETVAVDVGTGADAAINQHRGYVDTCMAEIWCLTHFAFVWSR